MSCCRRHRDGGGRDDMRANVAELVAAEFEVTVAGARSVLRNAVGLRSV